MYKTENGTDGTGLKQLKMYWILNLETNLHVRRKQ